MSPLSRRFRATRLTAVAAAMIALETSLPGPTAAGAAVGRTREKMNVRSTTLESTADGKSVELYVLTNAGGLEVQVMTYGATMTRVKVPDRDGKLDDVTLYLDTLGDYLSGHPLFGSVVGRYANRIDKGGFTIDGVDYQLFAGRNGVHIHGGQEGFQKRVWNALPIREENAVGVELTLTSPDGDQGYPGRLEVKVTYKLTGDNELVIDYTAETDKPTYLNLTNHAYWNLAGAGSGDVLGHMLMLNADFYLPTDERKVPLGELKPVHGTPMDFTRPMTVGSRIDQVPGGYDHCYVLKRDEAREVRGESSMQTDRASPPASSSHPSPLTSHLCLCARVSEPKTGRVMEVYTTQPGVQLYTANGLTSRLGAGGFSYGPHHGLCLETQHYPDSPHKPQFPSTLLRPGQTYHEVTIHKFSVRKTQ